MVHLDIAECFGNSVGFDAFNTRTDGAVLSSLRRPLGYLA